MCLGDFKEHVSRHIDGVLGGYHVGQVNLEGRILLEQYLAKKLHVSYTRLMGEENYEGDIHIYGK